MGAVGRLFVHRYAHMCGVDTHDVCDVHQGRANQVVIGVSRADPDQVPGRATLSRTSSGVIHSVRTMSVSSARSVSGSPTSPQ